MGKGYLFMAFLMVAAGFTPDLVVSPPDTPGDYHTVTEAVNAAPDRGRELFTIYIRAGVYTESVVIPVAKRNIRMVGDGYSTTIITGSRSADDGLDTSSTATFTVRGVGFIGQDLSFVNTAGPTRSQAVAFYSDADRTVLYRCSFRGYQDTLYAHKGRHLYKSCQIEGSVDFIFGEAATVFQDCHIVALRGIPGQRSTITAQGRQTAQERSAFTLQFCNITVAEDAVEAGTQVFLGRPWKQFSTVVVMESTISGAISPQGWLEWDGSFALDTLFFGEYENVAAGSDVSHRVGWVGHHVITDPRLAFDFTVTALIDDDGWLPLTGIDYVSGMKRPALSATQP